MLRTPDLCRKDLKYVRFDARSTRNCYIECLKDGCDLSVVYNDNAPHRDHSPCDYLCCSECVFGTSANTEEDALKMFNKLTRGYVNKKLLLL